MDMVRIANRSRVLQRVAGTAIAPGRAATMSASNYRTWKRQSERNQQVAARYLVENFDRAWDRGHAMTEEQMEAQIASQPPVDDAGPEGGDGGGSPSEIEPPADAELPPDPPPNGGGGDTAEVDRQQAITDAVRGLDADDPAHWTRGGKPQIPAIQAVVGGHVTAAERDRAWETVAAERGV